MAKHKYPKHHLGVPALSMHHMLNKSGDIQGVLHHDMGIFTESHNHIRHQMHKHGIHRHR